MLLQACSIETKEMEEETRREQAVVSQEGN
jgi:hypothetical protein